MSPHCAMDELRVRLEEKSWWNGVKEGLPRKKLTKRRRTGAPGGRRVLVDRRFFPHARASELLAACLSWLTGGARGTW